MSSTTAAAPNASETLEPLVQPQAQTTTTTILGNMKGFMSGVGSGVAKLVVGHPCMYWNTMTHTLNHSQRHYILT